MEYSWAQYLSFLEADDRVTRKKRIQTINDLMTTTHADEKAYNKYREQLEEGLLERK